MYSGVSSIALDTNVFVHGHNEKISFHNSSKNALLALMDSSVTLAIDEGFDVDESRNRSQIGCEYLKHVSHGSLGFAVLLKIFSDQRVLQVTKNDITKYKRMFNKVINKSVDVIFLSVAASIQDKTLVSNDFEDFTSANRNKWKKEDLVFVYDSDEVSSGVLSNAS